jgi:hypothetical protein
MTQQTRSLASRNCRESEVKQKDKEKIPFVHE